MHEIAATVGSASVVLIGIIFGIFFNQRGLDRLEGRVNLLEQHFESRMNRLETQLDARIDRLETQFDARINRLESHVDVRFDKIQDDLSGFHRSLGQHDKAIEVLEKRPS